MGYRIYLFDSEGNCVQVPRHNEGTIQQFSADGLAGTTNAEIEITYNYNTIYTIITGKSLRKLLNGKKARFTIPDLSRVVAVTGTKQYEKDYWADTPGNAGAVIAVLLDWARLHPDAVWEVN